MDRRHQTWATSERFVPRTFVRPFVRFSQIEAGSGVVLIVAALVAIVWANSPWSDVYFQILDTHLVVELGAFRWDESLLHVINDGLMTIFFFVVGLEIKRQLVLGDLQERRVAALPVLAAVGGMVLPAVIYLLMNLDAGSEAVRGWGIPMATDIAFAVGVLAILGPRVPSGAKLFLLTLAIADDIGAIAVIAIFYSDDLDMLYLAMALLGLGVVMAANRVHVRSLAFYLPLGALVWFLTLRSGVHATLAGVALALLTPARPLYPAGELDRRARAILDVFPVEPESVEAREHADHEAILLGEITTEAVAPLSRLEHRLQTWSSFVVIPLFALANAGVHFRGTDLIGSLTSSVSVGVIAGLVLGKTLGISLFAWIAVRSGLGRLPVATSWSHIVGLAAVGGVGFTVALFVAGLAFADPVVHDMAKVGIFGGSILSGVIGCIILGRSKALVRA